MKLGDLGDTDSLSVSSLPDTVGYFTYILSINSPRDLAVNIIIPTLQIRKLAQILTYLGQGHMPIDSRVSFQTKVCSLQNLFLFNVSHCFPNRGRSLRILSKIKNTCWKKRRSANIHWTQEIPIQVDKILLSTYYLLGTGVKAMQNINGPKGYSLDEDNGISELSILRCNPSPHYLFTPTSFFLIPISLSISTTS